VELLRAKDQFLVRVRSQDGTIGLAVAHPDVLETTWPILTRRVAPFFAGKDARDLDALIDGVYLASSNYKWQGLPFWVPVASVEFAVLDLLGKVAGKPLGELFGGVTRRDVAVYRASGNRGNTPEQEIAYLQRLVGETGAKAIKFRLGARMRYDDASTRRDLALIPLTRKTFGDAMTIYADANGSYDVPAALRIGRVMQEHRLAFLEEPVPFDYYDETKDVADQLPLPIAGGEQESSLRRFRWMIDRKAVDVVQPDLFYFGGFVRSIRVARMAEAAGMACTPHMSDGGLGYLYVAHFASCVPNAGPFQEYKGRDDSLPVSSETSPLTSVGGMLKVPTGPGLGVTIDPAFVQAAATTS
jgi:L-alanine-DL-glutamate epimerase-like enolase superfamily enzyme